MLPWAAVLGALALGVFCGALRYHGYSMVVGGLVIAIMAMWQDRAQVLGTVRTAWGARIQWTWAAYGLIVLIFGTRFLNAMGLVIGAGWATRYVLHLSN